MEFAEKSCTIRIDTSKCTSCETKACAAACKKYARGILEIDNEGKASVANHSPEEVIRLGTECLACEFACKFRGKDAITIDVLIKGLEEYLQRRQ
jgi:ferredoxin